MTRIQMGSNSTLVAVASIPPHISGHGWWMDVNEGMGDGMYVWVERGRLGTLEVNLNGYYADCVYPPATNA